MRFLLILMILINTSAMASGSRSPIDCEKEVQKAIDMCGYQVGLEIACECTSPCGLGCASNPGAVFDYSDYWRAIVNCSNAKFILDQDTANCNTAISDCSKYCDPKKCSDARAAALAGSSSCSACVIY